MYKTVHLDAASDVRGGESRLAFHVKVRGPRSRQWICGLPLFVYWGLMVTGLLLGDACYLVTFVTFGYKSGRCCLASQIQTSC